MFPDIFFNTPTNVTMLLDTTLLIILYLPLLLLKKKSFRNGDENKVYPFKGSIRKFTRKFQIIFATLWFTVQP